MRFTLFLIGALTAFALYSWWEQQSAIRESDRMLASIERNVVPVDAALYDACVGVCEVNPRFDIAITREADRLFAQGTSQIRVELYPASEATFFNEKTMR